MSVWVEAKEIFEIWEALTKKIWTCLKRSELEKLKVLLDYRQELCDRLDALKRENGIACWIDDYPKEERIAALQHQIRLIIKRLSAENEQIQKEMQNRMVSFKEMASQARNTRTANQAYRGRHLPGRGAFIDTRK